MHGGTTAGIVFIVVKHARTIQMHRNRKFIRTNTQFWYCNGKHKATQTTDYGNHGVGIQPTGRARLWRESEGKEPKPITEVHLVKSVAVCILGITLYGCIWFAVLACSQKSMFWGFKNIFTALWTKCSPVPGPEKKNDCEFVLNRFAHKERGRDTLAHTVCVPCNAHEISNRYHRFASTSFALLSNRNDVNEHVRTIFEHFSLSLALALLQLVCVCISYPKTQSKLMHSNLRVTYLLRRQYVLLVHLLLLLLLRLVLLLCPPLNQFERVNLYSFYW